MRIVDNNLSSKVIVTMSRKVSNKYTTTYKKFFDSELEISPTKNRQEFAALPDEVRSRYMRAAVEKQPWLDKLKDSLCHELYAVSMWLESNKPQGEIPANSLTKLKEIETQLKRGIIDNNEAAKLIQQVPLL